MVTISTEEYKNILEKRETSRAKKLGLTPEVISRKALGNKIVLNIRPFPAVRSNRNSWSKSVTGYHDNMNKLRDEIGDRIETVKEWLKSAHCEIIFYFAIPNSYSKKKAQETQGKPYLQKPDIDNLEKSLLDSVFYKSDDKEIYRLSAEKRWALEGEESRIEISYLH